MQSLFHNIFIPISNYDRITDSRITQTDADAYVCIWPMQIVLLFPYYSYLKSIDRGINEGKHFVPIWKNP